MDMNRANIEEIVRQVLSGMAGKERLLPLPRQLRRNRRQIPKTARCGHADRLEHYDIKEFPIPEVGDDDILVKVEGCGICGTDAHEFKRDPFGLIPVALGHEGTGEIVKMGKNVKGQRRKRCEGRRQGRDLHDLQGQSGHHHVRPE